MTEEKKDENLEQKPEEQVEAPQEQKVEETPEEQVETVQEKPEENTAAEETQASKEVSQEEKAEASAEAEAPAQESSSEEKAEDKPGEEKAEESEDENQGANKWVAQPKENDKFIREGEDSGFIEKVISINRITKVTKGGKKLSFSALVVVGDTQGNVGYSLSKAAEVATAIRKAMAVAKKNMIKVPMKGSTITHEIIGQCGGARVLLKPASEGTGVIASGPVRAVCDGAGIHNILTKCHRSNNPINVVKAAIDGLSRLKVVEN